jgi:DNA-binding XRE family transcriptional regulator
MSTKKITTFSEYMSDESRVSSAEREKIGFEVELIGKMIELRKKKGLSQRELADLSGLKQPAIARLESFQSTPQIDTLIKALRPLGYTISLAKL